MAHLHLVVADLATANPEAIKALLGDWHPTIIESAEERSARFVLAHSGLTTELFDGILWFQDEEKLARDLAGLISELDDAELGEFASAHLLVEPALSVHLRAILTAGVESWSVH